ncbi:syndecan-2 [Discoglossus pictus]
MRNIWILLSLGLVAWMSGATWAETQTDKDLYIDNTSVEEASGVYPIDDDDYASASGSGDTIPDVKDYEEITTLRTVPDSPPTSDTPSAETTTLKIQTKTLMETEEIEDPVLVEETVDKTEDGTQNKNDRDDTVQTAKHSENLFHRTEVLAAVIAGGGIGFLFAVFLILLLVYRMRKKDEGSYDLGERKPSSAVYQKAPTKEFYA